MSGCLGPEVRWQEMALPEKWCGFMEHKSERNREKNMSCYINMLEKVSHTHSELRHQRQGREHDWAPYLSRNIANIQTPTTFQSKHLLRGSPPPLPPPPYELSLREITGPFLLLQPGLPDTKMRLTTTRTQTKI